MGDGVFECVGVWEEEPEWKEKEVEDCLHHQGNSVNFKTKDSDKNPQQTKLILLQFIPPGPLASPDFIYTPDALPE